MNIAHLFLFNLFFIEVELNYNVVLITAVQQSDSVVHTHIYILFHYGLSQDIENTAQLIF